MISGNSTIESRVSSIETYSAAADTVEELLPERLDVRRHDNDWLVVEPKESKNGMLISGEINDLLNDLGFEFESTGNHQDCSHANHWYKYRK